MSAVGSEVLRTHLRNGLEVRLKEIHTAPLISCWVWYRAGSRNERQGFTGISHWVEHMQFRGTPQFPSGVLDRAISRDGGFWNALTYIDWTAYVETMPATQIDLALQLEADRMRNSVFDGRGVDAERAVIISERQGHENEPGYRLSEEVQAAAFRVHSYHHEIIGDMADLQTMTREDLYAYYTKYYVPSNAVLALAGDFRIRGMLDRVRQHFGPLPRLPRPQYAARPEPPQRGERRVLVEGPGDTPILMVAYRVPEARSSDIYPLTVLDSILAGASSLNMFGPGISNKTSRLYQRLVEGGLAASVRGSLAATIDPYLYTIRVTVLPDKRPEDALEALDAEVDRALQSLVEADEVRKAAKQAQALFAYGSESITNQAFWLGYSEMFADYTWFEGYLERLAAVQPPDVLAAAQKYLLASNRVIGIYRPTGEGESA